MMVLVYGGGGGGGGGDGDGVYVGSVSERRAQDNKHTK